MKAYKLFTYLLTLSLATLQASQMSDQELNNNNTNLQPEKQDLNSNQPDKKDLQLQKGITTYLPKFFKNNKQMLEKLQEGKRQAVVVIGQTGAGKSTLIGGLMGHKFIVEKQKITKMMNGRKIVSNKQVLVNKNAYAPKIGHSKVKSETTLPQAHLDKNLAFIDTAGLADTRKQGDAINLCSAIGLRSLIEKIGGVQCIIGVISYNNFIEGRGSKAFLTLLNATGSLLKNKPWETLTSSMVLAFTKVPDNITREKVTNALTRRCFDLMSKNGIKQMTEEDEIVEVIYKALFPSCYGLENKNDVPFFLINQNSLLKQGFVRKHMVPTLQNATQVHSKNIGLVLTPYLLQKTTGWLAKRAQSIVKHINDTNTNKNNIASAKETLLFNQQELLKQKELLAELTDPNNKDIKKKKEEFTKCLNETIQNSTQRIKELDQSITNNKKEQEMKTKEIYTLDTDEVRLYTKISGSYNERSKEYKYSYSDSDVPIHYITYRGDNTKDPELNQHLDSNYKVVSITKNYDQGKLNISLEKNNSRGHWWFFFFAKDKLPCDFDIYAQNKHVYYNRIYNLKKAIENLEDPWFEARSEKECLEKEIKRSRCQLQQLQSNNLLQNLLKNNSSGNEKLKQATLDLLKVKQMIEQTKKNIENQKPVIKKIESSLQTLGLLLPLLTEKIKQNEIIPYIITQVAPFIEFHNCDQKNIDTCKQYYINNLKQQNQHNNNLVQDNTNKKHIDYQPGGELEQKNDNDCDNNNNNNNSSSLTSSLLIGGTLLGSVLKKKN